MVGGRVLDLLGLVTMATGVVALLIALSQGNREGWSSQYIVWLFIIAGVSLGLFVLIELWCTIRWSTSGCTGDPPTPWPPWWGSC